jgi:beta-glucanase (GH16 family)
MEMGRRFFQTGILISLGMSGFTFPGGAEGAEALHIPAGGHISPASYPDMELVWRDEFSSASLNEADWTHETGIGRDGWGNEELQYYLPGNTSLNNGYLVITAKEESHAGRHYTSSRLTTREKRSFTSGRIDIRAMLPQGQGMWPALWMLGDSLSEAGWPACGEIDIMEMIGGAGREDTVHGTLHWKHAGQTLYEGGSISHPSDTYSEQFHVFSIIWDEDRIQWLADDRTYFEMDISSSEFDAFRAPFHLIINLAVGGKWPGPPNDSTVFPQRLVVDYVRVFQNR